MAKKKPTQVPFNDKYVFMAALVVIVTGYVILAYIYGVKQTAEVLGAAWPF